MIKQNLEPVTQKNGRITFSTENWGIVIAAFALFLILSIFCPGFFTDSNLLNILRESAFIGISAIALTFCIAAGFIDLSIGGMTALIAAITALTFNQFGFSAIAIGIGAGLLFGLVNGILVVFCRIASFIATMSTMLIYRAAVYIMLDEQAVIIQNKTFTQLGNGSLAGGIPIPFVVMIVCVILGYVILKNMPFGKKVLAIGNSQRASRVAGIDTKKVIITIFVLNGLFVAISSILITARLWMATGSMQTDYEFTVISAVVLGGTALVGGKGNVINSVVAAVFLAMLANSMTLFAIDPYWQYIIKGLILLFAFSLNSIKVLVGENISKRKAAKAAKKETRFANTTNC